MIFQKEKVIPEKRFEFGKNWSKFLKLINEERIKKAEKSLCDMIGLEKLNRKKFLDIGSGSGLFSLAARRLGARVHSFDYDSQSVSCTKELKNRYFPDDDKWVVEKGSILDENYVKSIGKFDIVYSWGVLHHTGQMWKSLANVEIPLKINSTLIIAIYNDQGWVSSFWKKVKKIYCSGFFYRILITGIFIPIFFMIGFIEDLVMLKNPFRRYFRYIKIRGMSVYYDWIDWFGGYPFETAKPEEIFDFYSKQGFILKKIITTNVHGNNQFVFKYIGKNI